MSQRSGIDSPNRILLDTLHQQVKGPFTAPAAAEILSLDVARTRRLLAYLAARGWLSRVRRGLYIVVPLGTNAPASWQEDPWTVAAVAFAPCYIGGWSACEHWGLTEQIFRDVVVITGAPIRKRDLSIQQTHFVLKFLNPARHFGTRSAWRGQTRVQVSDPTRTLVDLLDDPALGGGIRHVAEVLKTYFSGEHRNEVLLIEYGTRLGNRSVYKRLGYLLEAEGIEASELIRRCQEMQSSGLATLDPSICYNGRIVKRWNLRVNAAIAPTPAS